MMSKSTYDETWERKKRYLIRSLFHDLPDCSTIQEEFYSSDSSSVSPRTCRLPSPRSYRSLTPRSPRTLRSSPYCPLPPRASPQSGRYSPLPPLIIEREPNKHDEPEEYYIRLERKVKKIYRKLFLNEDTSISSIDDQLTMVDEDIGIDLGDHESYNEQHAQIAVGRSFSVEDDVQESVDPQFPMEYDKEISDDHHSTIEEESVELSEDYSPNEQQLTVDSDEWMTIDENGSIDSEPYMENNEGETVDCNQLEKQYEELIGDHHQPEELSIDHRSLSVQNEEETVNRQYQKEVSDHFSINRQEEIIGGQHYSDVLPTNIQGDTEIIGHRKSQRDVIDDVLQDDVEADVQHLPEEEIDHQEIPRDNLDSVDMSLTLNNDEFQNVNPINPVESSTDIEAKSTTSVEGHESNTISSVEDQVCGDPKSNVNDGFENLEVNRVPHVPFHIEDIEVMRTPRHQAPDSPHTAIPDQSSEDTQHFEAELSLTRDRNTLEFDKNTTFDTIRLSSPKNYFETSTNFENLFRNSNAANFENMDSNFENMDGRCRRSNIGIQTTNRGEFNLNILNDNLFTGSPKVFKLCSCMNHVCGN